MKDNRFPTYEQLQRGWEQMVQERDHWRRALETTVATYNRSCAEVNRLREALEQLAALGEVGMKPDPNEWLTFHDKVARIARAALEVPRADEIREYCVKCGERTDTYPIGSYHKCEKSI